MALSTKQVDQSSKILRLQINESANYGDAANQVSVLGCWNRESLQFVFRVHDNDLIKAPMRLQPDRFHAYDSLQIYLDPLNDSSHIMNRDDLDILLLPDARYAVLRGDELLQTIDSARVPQRVSAPLLIEAESKIDRDSWMMKIKIPFAGLGINPEMQSQIRFDIAMNDWLIDVAQVPSNRPERGEPEIKMDQYFLPVSLSGVRDFGFPKNWMSLQLVGAPPWHEQLVMRLGTRSTLLGMFVLCLSLIGASLGIMHWWHRKQIRALMWRIQQRDFIADSNQAPEIDMLRESDSLPVSATDNHVQTKDTETKNTLSADPRDLEFARQVLAYIRSSLTEQHTPATLAENFHVSVRTLQRKIRAGIDSSPQDLILAARLEHANELLQSGALRVSEVASRVGFDDLSHFSRRFRDAFGKSPSQVRGAGPN